MLLSFRNFTFSMYPIRRVLYISVKALEKARATGNYMDAPELGLGIKSEGSSHDTDSSDGEGTTRRVKKLKINSLNV